MTVTRTFTEPRNVGDVLAKRKFGRGRRTHQPVRRNSYNRGEREARFWQPVDPAEHRAILEAAKRHDLVTKKAGSRNGDLGHVALQVLEFLMADVRWRDGTLEPAIAFIMANVRRSRDAVVRALRKLKEAGFLDWVRRTEPVEAEGPGPRVRQIPNAYRITAPGRWAKRIAARVAQLARNSRPGSTAIVREPADPALAGALASLAEAVDRRNASTPDGQNPGPAL